MNDKIIHFLEEHRSIYPEYFEKDRIKKIKYGYTSDINQIYCYLDLIDIRETEYFKLFEFINKKIKLKNLNVLEVASGKIPILSSIIKENTNCKTTAINNIIVVPDYKGTETLEGNFTDDFDILKYDLIVGFRPCEATENIIDLCFKYNKPFIIYLCPCAIHPKGINFTNEPWTTEDFQKYIIKKLKSNKSFNIYISYKSLKIDNYNCPVIIGKPKE